MCMNNNNNKMMNAVILRFDFSLSIPVSLSLRFISATDLGVGYV